jgi:hypothetical protein
VLANPDGGVMETLEIIKTRAGCNGEEELKL